MRGAFGSEDRVFAAVVVAVAAAIAASGRGSSRAEPRHWPGQVHWQTSNRSLRNRLASPFASVPQAGQGCGGRASETTGGAACTVTEASSTTAVDAPISMAVATSTGGDCPATVIAAPAATKTAQVSALGPRAAARARPAEATTVVGSSSFGWRDWDCQSAARVWAPCSCRIVGPKGRRFSGESGLVLC